MLKNRGNLLVFLSLLFTLFLYFISKSSLVWQITDFWQASSQIASLIGTVLLAITFILSARFAFVEDIFGGLDKVYKKHHFYGAISFILLIHHPILLAIRALPNFSLASNFLLPSANLIYTFGVISLFCLILLLVFTLLIKLPYHWWFKTHVFMVLALVFAFVHIVFINSDVSRFLPLKLWILSWLTLGLIAYFCKRFFYKYYTTNLLYQVDKIIDDYQILDIYLKPIDQALNYQPGQFVFISSLQSGLSSELHPFSLASPRNSTTIRLCVKTLGDFTTKLKNLKIGSIVDIYGPHGRLYAKFNDYRSVVMIAGGVGIAPFISLIETDLLESHHKNINLFYSVRGETQAFYHQALRQHSQNHPSFHYFPIFTQASGHLSSDIIKSQIVDFDTSVFLLCGPKTMMQEISSQLKADGIKSSQIYYEDFSIL